MRKMASSSMPMLLVKVIFNNALLSQVNEILMPGPATLYEMAGSTQVIGFRQLRPGHSWQLELQIHVPSVRARVTA